MSETMTKTAVRPDTTSIEHLDYQHVPACEMVSRKGFVSPFSGKIVIFGREKDCPNSAEWFLVCMYCGDETYVCNDHRRSGKTVACACCRRELRADKARWVKL